MLLPTPRRLHAATFTGLLLALLVGCASRESAPNISGKAPNVNFSGHWEMNYAESDNVNQQLNAMVRELNRSVAREQSLRRESGSLSSGTTSYRSNSPQAILGLAELAELITRSQILEIRQDDQRMRVHRDQDFALSCDYAGREPAPSYSMLGMEICGWDGHQMVFSTALADQNLRIVHRLSLGAQGKKLMISTTVGSGQVSQNLTINRVFDRFDPADLGYECEMTMTRGRVCSTTRK